MKIMWYLKIKLFITAWRISRIKKVKHSRQVLRNTHLYVNGTKMMPMRYIDMCAYIMPLIVVDEKPLDHVERMRKLYLAKGLKGINLYVDYINAKVKLMSRQTDMVCQHLDTYTKIRFGRQLTKCKECRETIKID